MRTPSPIPLNPGTRWVSPTLSLETSDSKYSFAFGALIFLSMIIYVGPQVIFPSLQSLHLARVSAILAILAYGLTVISEGRRLTIMTTEVKLILALAAFALVSIPLSLWPGGSLAYFFDVYSKSLIVFFLVANLLVSEKRCRQLLWAISIFCAFNAAMATKQYLSGEFFSAQRVQGGFSPIASDPNDLALSLNLAIPFIWYLFESSKNRVQKVLWLGILGLVIVGVIVSFSRGGFLALLALSLWFAYIRIKSRRAGILIGIAMMFLVILWVSPADYYDRIVSIVDSSKDYTGSRHARAEVMKASFYALLEHPLGVGLKMNNLLLKDLGMGWNVIHSAYLELAIDLGIVPGILFIALILKLLASMRRIRSSRVLDKNVVALAEATEVSLVAYAVGGMFLPVTYLCYFYYVAGLAVAVKTLRSSQSPLSAARPT